jgi:hypothetical protein
MLGIGVLRRGGWGSGGVALREKLVMGDGMRSVEGRFVGVCALTPQVAAAICGRIAGGERLMSVGRDPAMPHRTTIRNWANRDEVFRAQLEAAMREARLERRRLDREVAAAKAARPAPLKGGSESTYTREVGMAICERLANGESLVSIARDPAMPNYVTVFNWMERHAEFADAYVIARQVQADFFFDEVREVALASTHATVWSDRLRFDTTRWQAARLAPKKYCERVFVDAEIGARRAEAEREDAEQIVHLVNFQLAPNGRTVLVAPPRCALEEQEWVDAYGHPYDGPR